MGKIKKIIGTDLVGGSQSEDIYPVTSIKAVYDTSNERLDKILTRRSLVNISTNYNSEHIAQVLTLSKAIRVVPEDDRTLGFVGTFLSQDGWLTYRFIGNTLDEWSNTSLWEKILGEVDIQELTDNVSEQGIFIKTGTTHTGVTYNIGKFKYGGDIYIKDLNGNFVGYTLSAKYGDTYKNMTLTGEYQSIPYVEGYDEVELLIVAKYVDKDAIIQLSILGGINGDLIGKIDSLFLEDSKNKGNIDLHTKEIGDISSTIYIEEERPVDIVPIVGFWNTASKVLQTDIEAAGWYTTELIPVTEGEKYLISGFARPATRAIVTEFGSNREYISCTGKGVSGDGTTWVNQEYTVPSGIHYISVLNNTSSPTVNKVVNSFVSYTKNELAPTLSAIEYIDSIATKEVSESINVNITPISGRYTTTGSFIGGSYYTCNKVPVNSGETYVVNSVLRSAIIPLIVMWNGDTFIKYEGIGTGEAQNITNYEFTIPEGVNQIAINYALESEPNSEQYSLYKSSVSKQPTFYTKEQVDSIIGDSGSPKYGIRWSVSNSDDLGERVFNAVGLTATIGIGNTNGHSDFDSIYPWSDIRRCNKLVNSKGAVIITYEGEEGFSLDGSNGDVFVEIPKFYYNKYFKDGYEYRVISSQGLNVHPAFIEDGRELDAIYVGAFEGYKDEEGKLRSYGGVMPTSNLTPAEFLSAAKLNGEGTTLLDMRTVDAIWTLMAIEFGSRNTNSYLGYGYADYWQPIANGYSGDAGNEPSYRAINITSTPTNQITIPNFSESIRGYFFTGCNIVICQNNEQKDILAIRKLVNMTVEDTNTIFTFDGDPITFSPDNEGYFLGSYACTCNWCESIGDINASYKLNWHTGRTNMPDKPQYGIHAECINPIRYRWIENIYGSLWHYLPDVSFNDLQMYICDNIKDYEMHKTTTPYRAVGPTLLQQGSNGNKSDIAGANYWITDLIRDPFNKGTSFGKSWNTELTSKKAFGAYYYLNSGNVVISHGGGFDHLWRCNMLTMRAWQSASAKWYLYGARIIYKNTNM